MKVVRNKTTKPTFKVTFYDDTKDVGKVFQGSPTGGVQRLHVVTYDRVVDLENPINTYSFPATFYDVTYPDVEIVVKS